MKAIAEFEKRFGRSARAVMESWSDLSRRRLGKMAECYRARGENLLADVCQEMIACGDCTPPR